MKNNVVFTQSNNKFYKIIRTVCVVVYLVLLISHFLYNFAHLFTKFGNMEYFVLLIMIVFHGIVVKRMYWLLSFYVEEFYIYENRIEAVTANGFVRNRVYFKDLKLIKEVKLLTGKVMYIFDDGRKNGLFNICKFTQLNNLKYNLRVHKTEQLEQFVFSRLASKTELYDGMKV